MDDRGSTPGTGRDFSLRHRVQTDFGGPSSFLSNGCVGIFPEGKADGVRRWPLTSI